MNDTVARLTERIDTWADAWSAAIWRACWQGAIAVALVWLVCVAWRRLSPRWQCWLWRLAGLKFALALLWAVPLDVPLLAPPPPVEVEVTTEPIALAPMTLPNFDESQVPLLEPTDVAVAAEPAPVWRPRLVVIALAVWFIGVAVCAIRLLRQWWSARRLRVGAGLVEDAALLDILDEERARAGLRRAPRLLVSETLIGPALVGIVRPAIVLPAAMLDALSPESLRLLLRHELTHLRRRDLMWNLLLAVVGAVFFFHPLLWLALRRHRQSQESACDAAVLESGDTEPASYGQLLVDVAAGFARARPNPAVTGVVGSAKTLRRRLAAMPNFRPPRMRTTIAITLLLCLTAPVGLVPWRLVAREPVDVVGDILANWEERANVESYVYDVSSELVVDHGTSDDPRLMSPKTTDSSTMTFARSGEKLALNASGETRPGGPETQEEWQSTWVFDGKENKSLGRRTRTSDGSTDYPQGTIDRSGTPSRTITLHRDFIPIRFARFPIEALQLRQCDLSHIKLEHESVEHNGCECAELLVPPLDPGSKRFVRVFVDRARDDVPVGVLIEVDGRVTVEYSLSYRRHPRAGWAISGWSWKSLIIPKGDVAGLLSNARHVLRDGVTQSTGKVDLVSFNQPIDDSVFELTLPAGTKVAERIEDKFVRSYLVQDDGNLELTEQRSIEPPRDTRDTFTIYYPFNEEESSRKLPDAKNETNDTDRLENGKSTDNSDDSVSKTEPAPTGTIVAAQVDLAEPDEPILEVTELGKQDAATNTKWTTLRGRFVYDGDPPEPRPLEVTKDIEYLRDKNLVDESLVVGDDGGIANIVVMYVPPQVEDNDGQMQEVLNICPDLAESVTDGVVIVASDGQLNPRVTSLWLDRQRLTFANREHHPYEVGITSWTFNAGFIVPTGDKVGLYVDRQESAPVLVDARCGAFPWARAYVLPRANPYVAVTAGDGRFEIKQLPSGVGRFRVWHERTGWLDAASLKDGYFKVKLSGESVQLPTLRVAANVFTRNRNNSKVRRTGSEEPTVSIGAPLAGDLTGDLSVVIHMPMPTADKEPGPLTEDDAEFLRELNRLREKYDSEDDAASSIVHEVLAAWQSRPPVQTVDCEISVNNFTDGVSSDSDEAATPARGLNRRTITLVRSGAKFIKTIKGEDWLSGSQNRVEFESVEAFDGSETRLMGGGTHTDDGVTSPIEKSGMIKRGDIPANNLFDDVNLTPLALSLSPRQAIAQYGCDIEEMKLASEHAIHDGRECSEFTVTRKAGPVERTMHIYVDRAREFLPIGLTIEFNGKVFVDYTIDYRQDREQRWQVTGWSWSEHAFSTEKSKWTARVKSLLANRQIADDVFELTYPVGTRVGEQVGDKLNMYVAEADGTLKLVETRENIPATPGATQKSAEGAAPDWTVSFTPGVSDENAPPATKKKSDSDDGAAKSPVVDEILTNWRSRPAINSLQYEFHVTNLPDDKQSSSRGSGKRDDLDAEKTIVLTRSGAKVIKTVRGEERERGSDDPTTYHYRIVEAYDGETTRTLSESYRIEKGQRIDRPTGGLIQRVGTPVIEYDGNVVGLDWAVTPLAALKTFGCDPGQLRLVNEHAQRDGRDCVELAATATVLLIEKKARLFIDRERDDLLVGLALELGGRRFADYSFHFKEVDRKGWTISDWTWFDHPITQSTWTSTVISGEVNEPVDNDQFRIEYPAGAKVTDISVQDGHTWIKHFVVAEDGTMRPVNADVQTAPKTPSADDTAKEPEDSVGEFGTDLGGVPRRITGRIVPAPPDDEGDTARSSESDDQP